MCSPSIGDFFSPKLLEKEFIKIVDSVDSLSLSFKSKKMLKLLASYSREDGVSYPRLETISNKIGLSKRQASRYTADLVKKDFLHRERNSRLKITKYYFKWHKEYGDSKTHEKEYGQSVEDYSKWPDKRLQEEIRRRKSEGCNGNSIHGSLACGKGKSSGKNTEQLSKKRTGNEISVASVKKNNPRDDTASIKARNNKISLKEFRDRGIGEIISTYHPSRSRNQPVLARTEYKKIMLEASKKYRKINDKLEAQSELQNKIISYIKYMKDLPIWRKEGGKYLQGLGNFLRARSWENIENSEEGRIDVAPTHIGIEELF